MYQNVNGLNSKLTDFYNNVVACNYDFIALTETWLSDEVGNGELFNANYNVYRKDRDFTNLGLSRGGGVLLAINNKFSCTDLKISTKTTATPEIDILGLKISINNKTSLYIFLVYIPPSTSLINIEQFFEILESETNLHSENVVFLLGDFNAPSFITDNSNRYSVILNNFQNLYNLVQINAVHNQIGRILDLIFPNMEPISVCKSDNPLVNEDKYHPALDFSIQFTRSQFKPFAINHDTPHFNFKKANYHLLYDMLRSADWSCINANDNVETACNRFYKTLHGVLTNCVPIYRFKQNQSFTYPPWFDSEIIH